MVACCPYCGCDAFHGKAIRADGFDPDRPERFASFDGHWFNKCKDCDLWSLHQDGEQLAIEKPEFEPTPYSMPAV